MIKSHNYKTKQYQTGGRINLWHRYWIPEFLKCLKTYIFTQCSEIPYFTYGEHKIVVPLGYQVEHRLFEFLLLYILFNIWTVASW